MTPASDGMWSAAIAFEQGSPKEVNVHDISEVEDLAREYGIEVDDVVFATGQYEAMRAGIDPSRP